MTLLFGDYKALLTVVFVLELRTGELIKDEYFTLFEAVGALEVGRNPFILAARPSSIVELSRRLTVLDSRQIMDSKMDSGYLGPGENQAHALEDDHDIMRELAPEEVVGIMDELLCHEVSGFLRRAGGYHH